MDVPLFLFLFVRWIQNHRRCNQRFRLRFCFSARAREIGAIRGASIVLSLPNKETLGGWHHLLISDPCITTSAGVRFRFRPFFLPLSLDWQRKWHGGVVRLPSSPTTKLRIVSERGSLLTIQSKIQIPVRSLPCIARRLQLGDQLLLSRGGIPSGHFCHPRRGFEA